MTVFLRSQGMIRDEIFFELMIQELVLVQLDEQALYHHLTREVVRVTWSFFVNQQLFRINQTTVIPEPALDHISFRYGPTVRQFP